MLALTVAHMHDNRSEGDILEDAPKIHLGRNCGRAQKTGGNGESVRLASNTTVSLQILFVPEQEFSFTVSSQNLIALHLRCY